MLLAQYTIRSKQDYIFKTNRVLEIVGASENISRAWDYLIERAIEARVKVDSNESKAFSFRDTADLFERNELDLVVLFRGGGNLTVLFRDRASYLKTNRAFSFRLMKDYPGMIPMAVSTEVTGNYSADYAALMRESDREKNRMVPSSDPFTVPFAMMDRETFLPFSGVLTDGNDDIETTRVSDESLSKRRTGVQLRNEKIEVRLFDDMVTARGEESLLAVVHADGNNMGKKITGMLGKLNLEKDYEGAVNFMRKFTHATDMAFTKAGMAAVEKRKKELLEAEKARNAGKKKKIHESAFSCRQVIAGGDDITFICNARYALEYTKAYLDAVQNFKSDEGDLESIRYSSCAGICIFHSHYPFARAYRIAEQACDDSAKQKVHGGMEITIDEGWIDFHYIRGGIGGDLKGIRENEGTVRCIGRPWLAAWDRTESADGKNTVEDIADLNRLLKQYGISRTAVKTLGAAIEMNMTTAETEYRRICRQADGLQTALKKRFDWEKERLLRALYDLSEVYDLWFGEEA